MKLFVKLLLGIILFGSVPALSQEKGAESKTEKKSEVESAKMKRKKDKMEWKARREKERMEKKSVREHDKRLQTKETRKRMKKNRQQANRVNQNKKEFFLIRLFRPKPRTGGW